MLDLFYHFRQKSSLNDDFDSIKDYSWFLRSVVIKSLNLHALRAALVISSDRRVNS